LESDGREIDTATEEGAGETATDDEEEKGETDDDLGKTKTATEEGKDGDADNGEEQDGGGEVDDNKVNEDKDDGVTSGDEKKGTAHRDGGREVDGGGKVVDDDDEETPFVEFNAPVIPMNPSAGADVAKDEIHSMDRWKEIQKQRLREKEYKWLKHKKAKPGSSGIEHTSNPGATTIMLANRRGTDEFNKRQKDLLKVLNRMQTTRQRNKGEMRNRMEQGQLPFKKQVTSPRFVEGLPIIKRVVRMTKEEELILDASMSFLEGLRVGVYKTVDPLSPKQKRSLKNWLDLLSISLPPEWALHETIGDLVENIDRIAQSHQDLLAVMAKHPLPRTNWSKSCGKTIGFTCGFWKLLHIMTVGVAEHRGGRDLIDARARTRVVSPVEAADTLREYMAHFFPCTECAKHFIAQYDQCEMNRRCDRLTGDSSTATDADWKELAKWLWEFHNDVSVRLLNQNLDDKRKKQQRAVIFKASAGPGAATMVEQVMVVWPTLDDCVLCFNEDGSFNEEAVFLHLERIYW
jgi:Erv1 / Alr family